MNPFVKAWRNYIRIVLKPGLWYSFAAFRRVVFHVAENKILAGREQRGEGDAEGRVIVITFFEDSEGSSPASRLVQPVDRSGTGLKPRISTVAELIKACGEPLPADVARLSAAEQEAYLEERFAAHDLRRFTGALETSADGRWTYELKNESNAEQHLLEAYPLWLQTKMTLARCLETGAGADRRAMWPLLQTVL